MPIALLTARASFHHFLKDRISGLDKNKNIFDFSKWNEGDGLEIYKDQPTLKSANDIWPLPTISVVKEKFFRKHFRSEYSFIELCKFYKNICQICLEKYPTSQLTVDHVDPKANHGTNFIENKTIACKRCNAFKGHKTPFYDKNGELLKGTKIPKNYIFIEEHDMREEWRDFIFYG